MEYLTLNVKQITGTALVSGLMGHEDSNIEADEAVDKFF
jgi:hypothetical protein